MKRMIAFLFLLLFIFGEIFGQTSGGGFSYVGGNNLASSAVTTMDFSGVTVTKFTFVPSSPILVNPAGIWEVALTLNSVAPSKIILEGASPTGSRIVKIAVTTNSDASVSTSRISTDPGTGIGTFTFQMNPSNVVATSLRIYVAYENAQQNQNASENTFLLKSIVFQDASGNNTTVYVSPGGGVVIPSAPVVNAPMDGALNTGTSVSFGWDSVASAVYVLQVSTSQTFTTTIVNQTGITGTSYTATNLPANTLLYWRVNRTVGGQTSAWSVVRSFNTGTGVITPNPPTLTSPTDQVMNQPLTIQFVWDVFSGAVDELQISSFFIFGTNIVDQTGITTGTYTATNLPANTLLYWRVRRTVAGQTSQWSAVRKFTTGSGIQDPGTFSGFSNVTNGQVNIPLNLTLNWISVPNWALEVRVLLDPSGTPVFSGTATIGGNNIAITGLTCGSNYMVQGRWVYGLIQKDWSTAIRFSTIPCTITNPVPNIPANNATDISLTPNMQWASETGASDRIQIMDQSGTVLVDQNGITTKNYTVASGVLQNNTLYHWRVQSTKNGVISDWSVTFKFTTEAGIITPGNAVISSPANNSTGNEYAALTLVWVKGLNSPECEYRVAKSSNFLSVLFSGIVSVSQVSLWNLDPATTYYWQVRGKNGSVYGEWTPVSNFMTRGSITGVDEMEIPNEFRLLQNYPNPFNPTTKISYDIPEQSHVVIKVWDILGKDIETLISSEKSAGRHEVSFDASKLSAGLYIYTIHAGNFSASKKMLLVK